MLIVVHMIGVKKRGRFRGNGGLRGRNCLCEELPPPIGIGGVQIQIRDVAEVVDDEPPPAGGPYAYLG